MTRFVNFQRTACSLAYILQVVIHVNNFSALNIAIFNKFWFPTTQIYILPFQKSVKIRDKVSLTSYFIA